MQDSTIQHLFTFLSIHFQLNLSTNTEPRVNSLIVVDIYWWYVEMSLCSSCWPYSVVCTTYLFVVLSDNLTDAAALPVLPPVEQIRRHLHQEQAQRYRAHQLIPISRNLKLGGMDKWNMREAQTYIVWPPQRTKKPVGLRLSVLTVKFYQLTN